MHKTIQGHVISHSHWDREWRFPIWSSRQRLIKMFKSLIDRFQSDPGYRAFLLDGQFIAIDDYLQHCPGDEGTLRRLVEQKKLFIGPWYNLPDEFPIDGEALVRNLITGIRKSEAFGGCLDVGYTSFGWGQISQLPQIYAKSGIDFVVLGKHVGKHRAPNSEFLWQGADGTEVVATRLGKYGRSNFYFTVVLPLFYGKHYQSEVWGFQWPGSGRFYHPADADKYCREPALKPDNQVQSDALPADYLNDLSATTKETLVKDHLFFGDGCDYAGPTPQLGKIIDAANQCSDEIEFVHSTLPDYIAAIRQKLKGMPLARVVGELRDGPVGACSANALATRMPIKILNRQAQAALIRYAEPIAALGTLLNIEFPKSFISRAWDYLLKAHSHDAINGVTQDKTVRDIMYRLEQVVELGESVFEETAAAIMQQLDMRGCDKDGVYLFVFNSLPRPAEHTIEAVLDIPVEWNCRRLACSDGENNTYPIQLIDRWSQTLPVCVENSRALPFACDRHRMHLQTGTIPAFGYRVYQFNCAETLDRKAQFWQEDYVFGSQLSGINTMENKFLKVSINVDGTINLLNKSTGKRYRNLHYFEDSGEAGDYWQRKEPMKNRTLNNLGRPATITLLEDGPLVSSFQCEQRLNVPLFYDTAGRSRSTETGFVDIQSTFTLKKDTPYVSVKTQVINAARDHRFRVCLPTGLDAQHSFAEGLFDVDKRPVAPPVNDHGIVQAHMETLPMQKFVMLEDASDRFTVLARNITEYSVSDDESRTLSLTLFRAMPIRICAEYRCAVTTDEQGSQCLVPMTFDYAIYPGTPDTDIADLYTKMETFVYSPRSFQMSCNRAGQLPLEHGLLSLEPEALQIAALKQAETDDGLVLRIFNSCSQKTSGQVVFHRPPKRVCVVNLMEKPLHELCVSDGKVEIEVSDKEIMTLLVQF